MLHIFPSSTWPPSCVTVPARHLAAQNAVGLRWRYMTSDCLYVLRGSAGALCATAQSLSSLRFSESPATLDLAPLLQSIAHAPLTAPWISLLLLVFCCASRFRLLPTPCVVVRPTSSAFPGRRSSPFSSSPRALSSPPFLFHLCAAFMEHVVFLTPVAVASISRSSTQLSSRLGFALLRFILGRRDRRSFPFCRFDPLCWIPPSAPLSHVSLLLCSRPFSSVQIGISPPPLSFRSRVPCLHLSIVHATVSVTAMSINLWSRTCFRPSFFFLPSSLMLLLLLP